MYNSSSVEFAFVSSSSEQFPYVSLVISNQPVLCGPQFSKRLMVLVFSVTLTWSSCSTHCGQYPRRACAARVLLCVCVLSVCLSVTAATAFVSACNQRNLRHSLRLFLD